VSDHGEQFREHGGLYHLNSIFEEEVRIPGFFVFGDKAVTPEQIAAMRLFRDRRTYNSDVNATVIDLLGAAPHRAKLPFASLLHGRSLLSPPVGEPIMAASTTSGVWEDDNPVYGVIMGDRKVVGGDVLPWACYDSVADPRERFPLPVAKCSTLLKAAIAHYPKVPQPKQ
jgi:arylsulfatase A-like enzyme